MVFSYGPFNKEGPFGEGLGAVFLELGDERQHVDRNSPSISKGPCTQTVYTLAPKYLYRDYFKATVYTIWAHGLLRDATTSS